MSKGRQALVLTHLWPAPDELSRLIGPVSSRMTPKTWHFESRMMLKVEQNSSNPRLMLMLIFRPTERKKISKPKISKPKKRAAETP